MAVITNSTFANEIRNGLSQYPKTLPSKYFYDAIGDKLFQDIMAMPEYYLTRTELKILEQNKKNIIQDINPNESGFDLLELGAGDGMKTKVLLNELLSSHVNFTYKPLDISLNALTLLKNDLQSEMQNLPVEIIHGDYFDSLKKLKESNQRQKLILFLGSNIGNLTVEEATGFLSHLSESLNPGDGLLVGFDLKKDPSVILSAYNDATGITEAFNKNLLKRINNELGGNFNLDTFQHQPTYNPETGTTKSYLVSTQQQDVYVEKLDETFSFFPWESIHTEISQKFDHNTIEQMAKEANLGIKKMYTDSQKYYANYLLTV
jgi:dimethylhistidine N-methyltransferase